MIAQILLTWAIAAPVAPVGFAPVAGGDVYTCEYIASEADEAHTPARNDLQIASKTANGIGKGSWTVTWPGKASIDADADDVQFGSVGGSVRLKWQEPNGEAKTAFISFSDVDADGFKAGWLSIGHPSLWQTPGYMCSTPLISQTKAAQ